MRQSLVYLLVLLSCAKTFAQEAIHFTTKQGLPSNHVYDIQEDAEGFMWFATNKGLVKYDGENFRTFTTKDGLPNNDIWALELDYKDRLWFFSKSKYQGFIQKDSVYTFLTPGKHTITPAQFSNTHIGLWFYERKRDLCYKEKALKYGQIESNDDFQDTLDSLSKNYGFHPGHVTLVINPITKELLVVSKERQFFFDKHFNFLKEENILIEHDNESIRTIAQFRDHKGLLMVDTSLLFFDFKRQQLKYIKPVLTTGLNSSFYYAKSKELNQTIQVSYANALLIFDDNFNLMEVHDFNNQNKNIGSYKDSQGNIWLRSFTNGISLLPANQLASNYYFKNKKVQKINKFQSHLYVGVNSEGFYKKRVGDLAFSQFISLPDLNSEVYDIKKGYKKDELLFIADTKSFRYKNETADEINVYRSNNEKSSYFKTIDYFENECYFTTSTDVFKTNLKYNNPEDVLINSGLLKSTVYNNDLFLGGSDGLHQLKGKSLQKEREQIELLNTSILSFLATNKYLVVGTDGRGVYLYAENKVIHLLSTDGYSIERILQKDNTLWLATNKGVHQVLIDSSNVEHSKVTNSFYEADGLLQNNINDIFMEGNDLYVATDIGLSKLNIKDSLFSIPPKLYFKTLNDTLIFANEQRDNISISFGLQNYVNQDNVSYQYRLLPKQNKWTSTRTKTINFSGLEPNLYTLEVKATDQHFNQSIKKQYLNVIPEWWQTNVAKAGFVSLAILSFVGFIKLLKTKIQQKEHSKAELNKKISGLELQALRSQMNPHFVHNSLNAIQYFIQRNEVDLSEEYLVKFSKLVRQFFEYSRQQNITIEEEINLLTNYLEIEKLRFEDKLDFNIKLDDALDDEEQIIPSMILQPIVENAVNHGVFHKLDKGLVQISFKKLDDYTFEVLVEDDGIGIKKASELFKTSSKHYQSHSSAVLKERIELLTQSKDWEIEYSIVDLSELSERNGTRVCLTIKQNV